MASLSKRESATGNGLKNDLINIFKAEYECHWMLSHQLSSVTSPQDQEQTLFQSLFEKHFVAPPHFARRVSKFIGHALSLAKDFHPLNIGWCPIDYLPWVEFYPFHLIQLCRIASLPPNLDLSSSLLEISNRATQAFMSEFVDVPMELHQRRHTSFIESVSFQNTLIDASDWQAVYSAHFPFIPILGQGSTSVKHERKRRKTDEKPSQHHGSMYRQLEMICARVIAKLMAIFLADLLEQESVSGKQGICAYFQRQVQKLQD